MTTLQHALLRGIGLVFQLEEGELLGEPVPSRDNRRAVLAYEATEGGAGVLGRLTADPETLARVARTALELMHYRNLDAAIPAADPGLLENDPDAPCVKGCYRCLLSYYNQPDHEHIDRTDEAAVRALLRLARSTIALTTRSKAGGEPGSWPEALSRWGLPNPDSEPLTVNEATLPLVWRGYLAAATFGPVPEELRAELDARGFAVATLPESPGEAPPPELAELLGAAQ